MEETRKRGRIPFIEKRGPETGKFQYGIEDVKPGHSYRFHVWGDKGKERRTWKAPDKGTPRQLQKLLDEAFDKFKAEVSKGEVVDSSKLTIGQWYVEFMNSYVANKSAKTYHEWEKLWKGRIEPRFSSVPITKVRPDDISDFYKDLRTEISAHTGRPLSASTQRKYHALLNVMFREAITAKKLVRNPCDPIYLTTKPPAPDKTKAQKMTDVQVEKALTALNKLDGKDFTFKVMVLLCLETGMRTGELHGLQWEDYNAAEGTISVFRTLQYLEGKGVSVRKPKTEGSEREVGLSDGMITLLNEWKSEQARWRETVGDEVWNTNYKSGRKANTRILPGNWMWTDEYGNPFYPGAFLTRFKGFLEHRAGFTVEEVKDIHIHTLRHTSASMLLAEGIDIVTISERLGHSQASTTLNIYVRGDKKRNKAAGNVLGGKLFGD